MCNEIYTIGVGKMLGGESLVSNDRPWINAEQS